MDSTQEMGTHSDAAESSSQLDSSVRHPEAKDVADFPPDQDIFRFGVKNYWHSVNHIALVVSDIGRSLGFYANVIGMQQVIRPDFDR